MPRAGWVNAIRIVITVGSLLSAGLPANAGLRDHTDLLIGAAAGTYFFGDPLYQETLATQFNYLTPENEMKWGPTEPQPGVWTLTGADTLVNFAQAHGMRVKGHNLVWHSQLPSYINTNMTAADLSAAMQEHIDTLVGRYKGKMFAWDVVNEAIADVPVGYRNTIFLQKLGQTYIADAFRRARQADPDALLLYNDYLVEGMNTKSDFMYNMLKGFLQDGVPIDGVGLQTHLGGVFGPGPDPASIQANIQRLVDLGLLVNISEMDIQIGKLSGNLSAQLATQRQQYHDVVAACVAVPGCHAVTFWGVPDNYSWINFTFGPDAPLLFDANYDPKPAYFGVSTALDPTFPPCGDGVTDSGEQCDDANLLNSDGCDSNCTLECANAVAQAKLVIGHTSILRPATTR